MIVPGIPFVQGKNNYPDSDGVKYGLAFHNTSNDASDSGEASYATWRPDGVSAHLYVDGDSVTQSLDTARKAGHAGSSAGNENSIAIEIRGGNGMSRAWWLTNVAWDKLGAALALIIRHHWPDGSFQVRRATVAQMKANPKIKACYGHDDMRIAWGGTTHTDPGPNFPWDRLFLAINTALSGSTAIEEDDMQWFANADREYPGKGLFWFGDRMRRRLVDAAEKDTLYYVAYEPNVIPPRGGIHRDGALPHGNPIVRGNCDGMGPIDGVTVDTKALAAELAALGVSGATADQVKTAVTQVLANTRFTPAPK